jgi:hypothetical protein
VCGHEEEFFFLMADTKSPQCPACGATMEMLFRTVNIIGDEMKSGNVGWDFSKNEPYKAHGDYFDPYLNAHITGKKQKERVMASQGVTTQDKATVNGAAATERTKPFKISPETRAKTRQMLKFPKVKR